MRFTSKAVKLLCVHYQEIALLEKINALLEWDLNVNLPKKASKARAGQSAYVTKLISDKWLDLDFRKNLEEAATQNGKTCEESAIVRNILHSAKYYHRVPQEIIVALANTTSEAFGAWREAREKNEFKKFAPYLEKIISLNQMIAMNIGYNDNPYDALLDIYEPAFTASEGRELFGDLTKEIGKILNAIKNSKHYNQEHKPNRQIFKASSQKAIAEYVLNKIGYDFDAGRQDVSAHPFTTNLGKGDVRITNRYGEDGFIESIMVAMHEGGHALYEQGINPDYADTPLEEGASLVIHESQSRFWENQIGRSREFIGFLEPVLRKHYKKGLPEDLDSLHRAFNVVRPSLIRVEADEVTYNLHIALRFEIEDALINGKININNLPDEWNERMGKYLGVVPKGDQDGVLQDVHWAFGNFGYFPTYALGNLYAAQFAHFMNQKIDTTKLVKSGDFGKILKWQRGNIHEHGSLYLPSELLLKTTNTPLSTEYFINYLSSKYLGIYN